MSRMTTSLISPMASTSASKGAMKVSATACAIGTRARPQKKRIAIGTIITPRSRPCPSTPTMDAMAASIEHAGVKFQTGYFMRGNPIHLFLREQIHRGNFGKITRVRGSNCHSGALGGWFDTKPENDLRTIGLEMAARRQP